MVGVDTVVVVPARDEADRIAACLKALAEQTLARDAFELVVVIDDCRDATRAIAVRAAATLGLAMTLVPGPGRGSGPARRGGMELAARRLLLAGRLRGLIATTDADSRPAPSWLTAQRSHLAAGADVVAGRIELDEHEAAALPSAVLTDRARRAALRLSDVRRDDPQATHHHFAGASIGVTASVYARVGGMPPCPDLEDEAFARRLRSHGVPILRPDDVIVTTSARTAGRATRGLSADLAQSLHETGKAGDTLTVVTPG